MVVADIAERHPVDDPTADGPRQELRVLLGEYRDEHVRRGPPAQTGGECRAALNFLESLGVEPSFTDYRAAIVAHRRAKNTGRAAELVERVMAAPVPEAGRWFSLVQLLTEAGQVDRASTCSPRSPVESIPRRWTRAGWRTRGDGSRRRASGWPRQA